MNDNEALAKARDILERGWCKGSEHANANGKIVSKFDSNRTASCLLGALDLVSINSLQENRLQKRVKMGIEQLAGRVGQGNYTTIWAFNDYSKTTKEDVLLVLKYAEELE